MEDQVTEGIAGDGEPQSPSLENEMSSSTQSDLAEFKTAEEILEENIVIFRGTVENIETVVACGMEREEGVWESVSEETTMLRVKGISCLRGELRPGDTCMIELPGESSGYEPLMEGDLFNLEIGSEAIFMPYVAEDGTYYYRDARGFLFQKTENGVSYATDMYEVPSKGNVTLDDVEIYLTELLQ